MPRHLRTLLYLLLITLLAAACSSGDSPEEDLRAPAGFGFTIDPQTQTVTLFEGSVPSLAPQQADEPRALTEEELPLEAFSFKFLPGNILRIEASFRNASGFAFEQPFTFSPTPATDNIVSSAEPTVSDADLGGDGALSPGETTSVLVFEVVHKNEPFSYFVIASAVVTDPTPNPAFTVNATDDLSDAEPGDGVCEAEAGSGLCSLRAAVEETNALEGPDTVILPAGTYPVALDILTVTDDLVLEGAGQETTSIQGDFFTSGAFFRIDRESVRVTLRNLGVRGTSDTESDRSDGIRNLGTLTLEDVIVADHISRFSQLDGITNMGSLTLLRTIVRNNGGPGTFCGGSGVSNGAESDLTALDSRIESTKGVGIRNEGSLRLEQSFVSRNCNGGITNRGEATMLNSTILRNSTESRGGGVANLTETATLRLEDSVVLDNSAFGSVASGGGIYNLGSATVLRTTVAGNGVSSRDTLGANLGGGIYNDEGGSLILENSTVSGNDAGAESFGSSGLGGGLANSGAASVVSSTFSENLTYDSGGELSDPNLPGDGGALYNEGALELSNTILANSVAVTECAGTLTSLGNNLADDSSCDLSQGSDLSGTDPLLGPLADNGGPTQTHALLPGSPAIDAGSDTGLATDQRGVARPQRAAFDVGAFELE